MSFQYPKGTRFICLKCGLCCGDTPKKLRHPLLLCEEAERIVAFVGKPVSEFAAQVEGKEPYTFDMKKVEGKCVFLADNKCTIYSVRPLICRFYPFELKPAENGQHAFHPTDECPGLGKGRELLEEHFRKLFRLAQKRTGLSADVASAS